MDLLIKGATVYDGSTGEPARADVAVAEGVIAAVGDLPGETAAEMIDADGLALMPGVIDCHTHFDAQITWDPYCAPSPALGVSTVLIGNCGFTIAPCKESDRDLIMKNLVQVEGMSLDVLRRGVEWGFESFPDYMDMLEDRGAVMNVGAFLGHSAIRTYVMGGDATKRAANDDEIAEMARIVEEGMAAGAVGFATSTAPQHNGWGGVPMPSRLAGDAELLTLVKAMGKAGKGVFMLTKGDRTDVPYLENVAAEAGRPVMVAALLHNPTNPTGAFTDLENIKAARGRGREMWGQVSCCPLTMDFTLKSAYPLEGLTAWQPAMALEGGDLKALYAGPDFRQAVRDELKAPAGVRLFNGEWDKLELTGAALDRNRDLEHQTVDKLAAADGKDPLDWMLDFAIGEDLESVFTAVLLNSDEDAVGRILRHPAASLGLSDAGAHLTFFCDAGFGLHLLGRWARDLGAMSMPEAVHELTGKPAAIYRIPNRGYVREGHAADLLLFDPKTVGRGPKRRVFDLPGGAARLTTEAEGVHGVWVNGRKVADAGGVIETDARPGRVLREFGA